MKGGVDSDTVANVLWLDCVVLRSICAQVLLSRTDDRRMRRLAGDDRQLNGLHPIRPSSHRLPVDLRCQLLHFNPLLRWYAAFPLSLHNACFVKCT